jgi:hypothetical protein
MQNSSKIHPEEAKLFLAGRWTDMMKLFVVILRVCLKIVCCEEPQTWAHLVALPDQQ